MIYIGTLDHPAVARRKNILPDDQRTWTTHLIRQAAGETPSPHAFVVEQPPHSHVRQHFHPMPQFQLVVAGAGVMGRHEIGPVMVHYAGPHSSYGPIVAGPEGLQYFTLRFLRLDHGSVYYLPDDVGRMRRSKFRRHVLSEREKPVTDPQLRGSQTEVLISPCPDGLAGWLMRLAPGAEARTPEHPGGLGRFHVVTRGSVRMGGVMLPRFSAVWCSEGPTLDFEVASDGADLAVLQFPSPAFDSSDLPDYGRREIDRPLSPVENA